MTIENISIVIFILLCLYLIAKILKTHFFIGIFGTGIEFSKDGVCFHILNMTRNLPNGDTEPLLKIGMMLNVYFDIENWCINWSDWRGWQLGPIEFSGPDK